MGFFKRSKKKKNKQSAVSEATNTESVVEPNLPVPKVNNDEDTSDDTPSSVTPLKDEVDDEDTSVVKEDEDEEPLPSAPPSPTFPSVDEDDPQEQEPMDEKDEKDIDQEPTTSAESFHVSKRNVYYSSSIYVAAYNMCWVILKC